ncbi:MAG: heme-binding protein [Burkholderiales bacterium]|nr:MAG: heme-binding protein [Burkholderiales bacterium]TAG77415.1 MAG: heme-binding protein [Betaproteobacteria bacterium]
MKRFLQTTLFAVSSVLAFANAPAGATDMSKTLRVAFQVDITGFDPQATNDLYSGHVNNAVFDVMYEFDYYVRPMKLRGSIADGLPEISADGLTWTIKIKKGQFFADDPVFKGKKRELVAEDLVYSWKRMLDPKIISPTLWHIDGKLVGADALVAEAKKTGEFDYDKPIEGLKAIDRYTVQMQLTRPDYVLTELMLGYNWSPVAREVIDAYKDPGGRVMSNPVGVGPYRIKDWKKGSKVVLTKNENFREEYFPTNGEGGDAETLARNKGKRIPLVGNIDISIIEEGNPRLLSFKAGTLDYEFVGIDMIASVLVNGKLSPELAARGIRHQRALDPALSYDYFNLDDPVVGGLTPDRIALRRAIIMAYPVDDYVRVVFRNQAEPANQIIPPTQTGHNAKKARSVRQDLQLANALLDHYNYKDKDGDGFRDMPDGKPLVITRSTTPRAIDRETDELWKKTFDSLKIKVEFNNQKWPDLLKQGRAGQLQFWGLGWISSATDGNSFVQLLYSKNIGQSNFSRLRDPRYDELYERAQKLPIGPKRWALYTAMNDIAIAYSVWNPGVFRYQNVVIQPWLENYKRNPFRQHFWHFMDLDESKRSKG